MKLNYQQLEQHLNKTLASVYVVSGDELLMVNEAIQAIRDKALQQGFSERVRLSTENADWGKLLHANAHSLSLFAAKRLLELDLRNTKLQAENTKLLQSYAKNPCTDTVLLVSTNKLDSKTEQSAWYRTLEQNGVALVVWPITADQLPQWIMQRAKKLALPLTQASASWLAERAEGNLLAAAQELEKLCLLRLTPSLQNTSLEELVIDNSHFDVFDLVSSVLNGNSARSLRILTHLLDENIEATLILWALTRELRTLAEIMQRQQHTPLTQLFSQFRIWEKRQPGVRAFLKRHSLASCWNLLLMAEDIDQVIKGALGNTQTEIERLILEICLDETQRQRRTHTAVC